MNVLNLTGPEFLRFYVLLLVLVTAGAGLLRYLLRGPGGDLPQTPDDFDPHEIAFLASGPRGAVDAALAGMIHSGVFALSKGGSKILVQQPLPAGASPIQRELYHLVTSGQDRISAVRRRVRQLTSLVTGRLHAMNLALMPGQTLVVRLVPALLVACALLLGMAKISVGLSRNRPVGYLTMLCLLTGLIAGIFAFLPAWRTRSGDRLLGALRLNHAALRSSATTAPQMLAANDLVMALALFGPTAVLTTGALLDLRYALWPPKNRNSGSSGWGCGSSGCGGASGCGGGGCGGGGCGGCGG